MDIIRHGNTTRRALMSLASALALAVTMPALALPQNKPADDEKHSHQQAEQSSPAGQSLADRIRELQAKVAKLEAALKQKRHAKPSEASGGKSMKMGGMPMGSDTKGDSMQGMGMGMMGRRMMGGDKGGMMGMGMMNKKGAMSEKEMSAKGRMSGKKMMGRMRAMGGTKGTGSMKAAEPLPAFPGAPGIYHVGATAFYLDQADKVSLTPQQQTALKQIKEEAMSQQAAFDEQIADAEEELGMLTGPDQPDAAKIDAQVRDIERLRGDQRMAFIRSVGRAADVLTDQQRKTLVAQHAVTEDATTTDAKVKP